jgi:hypothetical protein
MTSRLLPVRLLDYVGNGRRGECGWVRNDTTIFVCNIEAFAQTMGYRSAPELLVELQHWGFQLGANNKSFTDTGDCSGARYHAGYRK